MDPEQLLAAALEALKTKQPDAVLARLEELGAPTEVKLKASAAAQEIARAADPQARLNERGGSAVGDFARQAAQGATFGFADEIAGMFSPEAGARQRQATADLSELAPGASLASSVVGGLTLPGAGALGGLFGASKLTAPIATAAAGRTVPNLLGRGLVTGAGEGALFGLGEAEGNLTERLPEAGIGAAIGAATGMVPGMAVGAGRVVQSIGKKTGITDRVVTALRENADVGGTLRGAFNRLRDAKRTLSNQLYRPFDEQFEEVTDPNVTGFIRQLLDDKDTASLTQRVISRNLQKTDAGINRPPSFSELQALRREMRARGRKPGNERFGDLAEELNAIMADAFPGLPEVDAQYAQAIAAQDALLDGYKTGSKSADQIAMLAQDIRTPEAQQAFREGVVYRTLARLEKREDQATGLLRTMMNAGNETRRFMRTMFPDDESFDAFSRVLAEERDAQAVWGAFKKFATRAAAATGVGAGFGTAYSLFNN